jgi:hypothetical protein
MTPEEVLALLKLIAQLHHQLGQSQQAYAQQLQLVAQLQAQLKTCNAELETEQKKAQRAAGARTRAK